MLIEKERIIENFRHDFVVNYDHYFATETFRNFGGMPIHNALLDLYTTYSGEIGLLYELFYAADHDLPASISLLHRVRSRPDDPRGYIRDVLIPELMNRSKRSDEPMLNVAPGNDSLPEGG